MPVLGALGGASARALGWGIFSVAVVSGGGGGGGTPPPPTSFLYNFTSQTFTHAGAEGANGPSLGQCSTAYAGAAFLNGFFSVSNGTQQWTCPATGTYRIECVGANGGSTISQPAGRGARICLLYTSPSPRDRQKSRMPSSA